MHRSGTSITTKWLQECGLNVGDDLLGPQLSNKSGHYEDMDFYGYHEKVFKENGMPFGGFDNFEQTKLNESQLEELKNILQKKSENNEQWSWKDPRTCLFIDSYLKLVPEAKVLIISRNYNEIIQSLIYRETRHIKEDILKDARWGILSYMSYELKEGIKLKKELGKFYSKATIHYYKKILECINNTDSSNRISVKFGELLQKEDELFKRLKEMQFNLVKFPLKSIFKSSYLTSNKLCLYIPYKQRKTLRKLQDEIEKSCI
jgi:hypothetical protein